MGSGRISGIACALATGLGVIITALISLFGAAIILYKIPLIYKSLTVIGCVFLIYFAKKYIDKALSTPKELIALENINKRLAFRKAFIVLVTNPKMMTTWLAIISLFPILTNNLFNIVIFSIMAGISSFSGHAIFATIFSTKIASNIYMRLYKPINGLVGIGFIIYAMKLFLNILG